MEMSVIYIALVLTGLALGSFAGAMVWRLRARQLSEDKENGETYDHKQYKQLHKLTEKGFTHDRSQCLHCSYVLRWYDLVPLVSWVLLGGKCRNCHKKIGVMEPAIELGMAGFFVLSYVLWPYSLTDFLTISRFVLWLAAGVGLGILFLYDLKWFLLPDRVNLIVVILGVLSSVIAITQSHDVLGSLVSIAGATIILSGVYYLLHKISKGRWIGLGDVKLGLGLALLLGDYRLAFIALFAANLIGTLIVLPALLTGKMKRDSHVPFGPLLIAGTFVAQLVGFYLIDWYIGNLL